MRILITADLHYDIARSRQGARELAQQVCDTPADAVVLVGDSAGADLGPLGECLNLFGAFAGKKFFVPGNHCLWCRGQENSIERYEHLLPQAVSECGFSMLDHSPAIMEGSSGPVGLVGSIGWYDYSFRDESLGIPEAFYRAKVAPGAAAYLREYNHLVAEHKDVLTERQFAMGARWMDGVHVKLGMSDPEFVEFLAMRLAGQLAELAGRVEQIAAFIHHVPFRQLIPTDRPDRFAFAAAYMGAGRIGQVLLACPKVRHVYCGHSHWPGQCVIGQASVVNVGSTYTEKKLLSLEL